MANDLTRPTTATGNLRLPVTGPLPPLPAAAPAAAEVAPAAAALPAAAPVVRDATVLGGGTGPLNENAATLALGEALTAVVPAAAAPAGPAPMDQIQAETEAVEEARAAVTELETELAEALSRFGPALSEAQQAEFVATFKAQHAGEYGAEAAAEATLASTLAANQGALAAAFVESEGIFDFACRTDHEIALDAYKALGPAHAQTVADFASQVLADPAAASGGLGDLVVTELIQPNMAALAGAAVAQQAAGQAGGAVAIDALQAQLGTALSAYLVNAGDVGAAVGGTAGDALANVRDLRDSLGDLSQVFKSDPEHFSRNLAGYAEDWAQKGGMGRVMAAAGLVAGAMACGDAMDDGLATAIGAYANTAKGACELVLGLKAVTAALGPQAALIGARAVPLLGAISNASNAWDLAQQGDLASMGAAGGEAMAAMGGLMVAFGVGTGGAGPALIALGTLASMGFRSLGEWSQQQGLDAEFTAILTNPDGLNLDPELTRRMLQFGPGGMEFLATEYGLPLDQLPAILQEPGMADLLFNPLPPAGLKDDWSSPYMQFMNQHFRQADGTFDGPAYLDFVRKQVAAAEGVPGADAFAMTGAMMGEMNQILGAPQDAAQWAEAFDRYEAWLDGAEHLSGEMRALAKAHLGVMRAQAAG